MNSDLITRADALRSILVASHPRSGTHLVLDLLRHQFRSCHNWRLWALPLDYLYLNLERLSADERCFDELLAQKIINRPRRALMKTHFSADWNSGWTSSEAKAPTGHWRQFAESAHLIYVIRHPLDVMASYKQFLSTIDPEIAKLNFWSFLTSLHWDQNTDRLDWWFQHVQGWLEVHNVQFFRYEDIIEDPNKFLTCVSHAINEVPQWCSPLLPTKVTSIAKTRLDRLLSLSPSSTAIIANRNRFQAHDWRHELSIAEKAELTDRIGPLLERFNYSLK